MLLPVALRFFYIVGPIFAIWAVVLTVLGVMRPDFPRRMVGERVVIGISVALMLGVILSATIGAKFEHPEQPGSGPEKHGERGNPAP